MSDIESKAPKPTDANALLGSLLSNPDLMRNISSMLGKSEDGATEKAVAQPANATPIGNSDAMTEGISRVLSNPEMMAKLPDVMKMIAPMMQQTQPVRAESSSPSAAASQSEVKDRRGCRNDLLIALKPFLSPERCRAIDMLLGLSRLGDVLQKMM